MSASKDSDAVSKATGVREFLGHVRNYLSAGLVSSVFGILAITVLTHLLTPAEYGILAVFLGIVSFFSVLLELNFRGAVNRYYLERSPDFSAFLKTVLLFLAGFIALSLAVFWWLRRPFAAFLEIDTAVFYVATVCAALHIPWNLNWKIQVAQLQSGAFARLSAAKTVALFVVGAVWIVALVVPEEVSLEQAIAGERVAGLPDDAVTGAHWGQIYGMLAVTAAFAAGLVVKLVRMATGGTFKRVHLTYALAFGIPLMPHSLATFALGFFDRVIINQLVGERAAGLYSFAYDVGMSMSLVVTAMNQAWLPMFSRYRDENDHGSIAALSITYTRYVCAAALVLVLFAREIAVVLASGQYLPGLPLIPVIICGYVFVFLYTLYANHSFYLRRTGLISLATLLVGAVNIGLNYALIPTFGFAAAAWTTLASYALLFGLHYVIARFVLRETVVPAIRLLAVVFVTFAVAFAYLWAEARISHYWITLVALKLPILGAVGLWLYCKRSQSVAGQ